MSKHNKPKITKVKSELNKLREDLKQATKILDIKSPVIVRIKKEIKVKQGIIKKLEAVEKKIIQAKVKAKVKKVLTRKIKSRGKAPSFF